MSYSNLFILTLTRGSVGRVHLASRPSIEQGSSDLT